jgi:hypothetical protein
VSHFLERPLCDMGRAYDFAYRPTVGDPVPGDGGGCDDRPHRIELYAAEADRTKVDATWLAFEVCPEHEAQLRRYDERLAERGLPPRFRTAAGRSDPGRAR